MLQLKSYRYIDICSGFTLTSRIEVPSLAFINIVLSPGFTSLVSAVP